MDASDCGFFLELFQKFQKIFKSTNEQILLIYIVYTAILKRSSHKYLIKKLFEERGNAQVVLSFLYPTNDLKDYSEKLLSRNLFKDCKTTKSFGI